MRSHTDKLVILDEIQNLPDVFKVIRGLIDENRLQGRNSHQYLLLGSASMDLMRQTSQSLAGRISYLEMSGLNVLEINKNSEDAELKKLWLRGGFPNIFLAESDEVASNRLENLIRTYVERDMPQNGYQHVCKDCALFGQCWLTCRENRLIQVRWQPILNHSVRL